MSVDTKLSVTLKKEIQQRVKCIKLLKKFGQGLDFMRDLSYIKNMEGAVHFHTTNPTG